MRTTLTLDDNLARELKKRARLTDQTFKSVVNETLRRGLSVADKPSKSLPRFRVRPHSTEFRPGIDVYRLNQLNDELETEDFLEELREAQSRGGRP